MSGERAGKFGTQLRRRGKESGMLTSGKISDFSQNRLRISSAGYSQAVLPHRALFWWEEGR